MAVSQLAPTGLLDAYRSMLTVRRFEERVLELRRADVFAGSIHLCAGQEAVPVGALAALDVGDRVVATYRGHGWALASGVPLEQLMAEVCQRATGVNGGRGGSAHLMAPEFGFLGENSIVGAGMPIGAGAALAAQVAGAGRVVVVSIGDGATSQGATHEALVFAAYRKLPLVVVCENNGWSEMTPIDKIAPVRGPLGARRGTGRRRAPGSTGTTRPPCAKWCPRRPGARAPETGRASSRLVATGSGRTTTPTPSTIAPRVIAPRRRPPIRWRALGADWPTPGLRTASWSGWRSRSQRPSTPLPGPPRARPRQTPPGPRPT